MNNKTIKIMFITLSIMVGSFKSVMAKENTYVSIGYASLNFEKSESLFNSGNPGGGSFSQTTLEDDNSGTPIKLLFGYQFSRVYSLELVYFDIGQFEFTKNGVFSDGTNQTTTQDIDKFDGNLIGVSNKFTYQANQQIDIFGRLGLFFSKGDVSERRLMVSTIPSNNSDYTIIKDYSEKSFEIGVGAAFNVTEGLSINIEYVIYTEVANSIDANATVMSVKYNF